MKKTIAWIAIFAALLGLTACGSAGEAHHLHRNHDRAGRQHL